MKRAVVYCRVSTDKQVESGAGLDAQRHACAAWAAREGFAVVGPYVEEEGVSGATPLDRRDTLMSAIGSLTAGDVLLVSKRDRVSRDPIVTAMIEAAVARKKSRLVSAAGEGTDGNEPTDVLMRRIVDAFAEYERLIIGSRTRAALRQKKRQGQRTGRVPFGADLVDDGRRSRAGHPIGLTPNAAEQELVDRIRQLRKNGATYRTIAWQLNKQGFTTKAGKPWTHSSVHHILTKREFAPDDCPLYPAEKPARPEAG